MIIVFSGIDGAGKSTQINQLKELLISLDYKVKYFWSRGGYTPGFELLKKTLRKSSVNSLPPSGKSIKRERALNYSIIRKTWLFISIVDLIIHYVIYLRILKLLGYTIICDRYIHDTKIDFLINFPNEKVEKWIIWKLLLLTSPKPNHSFLLLIPVEESLRRSKIKNDPYTDSKEVLEMRYKEYQNLLKDTSAIYLKGDKSIKSIHQEIKKVIFE